MIGHARGKQDVSVAICSDEGSIVVFPLVISVELGKVLKLSSRGEIGSKVAFWFGWARQRLNGIIGYARGKQWKA